MNILLIQPDSRTSKGVVSPPLAVMAIAPILINNGFDVKIYDANFDDNSGNAQDLTKAGTVNLFNNEIIHAVPTDNFYGVNNCTINVITSQNN